MTLCDFSSTLCTLVQCSRDVEADVKRRYDGTQNTTDVTAMCMKTLQQQQNSHLHSQTRQTRPCVSRAICITKILEAVMAASRSKRHNAGKNIGKLLDQELDADDFYKTAYGGFEETLEDGVYQSEDSDDDEVDSDFDAPEHEGSYLKTLLG